MVVSREANATEAGVSVLKAGGNAVDAAVAIGFALAVTHPSAGNLGGGGFMLIRFASGGSTFIDYRERAPEKASKDMYIGPAGDVTRESQYGYRAPGTPGTPRGLEYAHGKYGRTKWARLLAPAVKLAQNGFPISYGLAKSLKDSKALVESPESRRIFQRNGKFYEAGEVLVQPELAATLRRIAARGASDFYEGETARRFAQEMAAGGGLISLHDLQNYRVVERMPLEGAYRGYRILTAPPPSAGGVGMLQMMGVLEGSGYEAQGAGSALAIHWAAEAMRRFYADRAQHLGDPDFHKVPVRQLLDRRYVEKLRASIDSARATPSASVRAGEFQANESAETTHYSVVDAEGNAVAVTYTLNGGYGSGVTLPGLGFLLNNEMDDFAAKPGVPNKFGLLGGEANAIAPLKRPLSSMTPTIVLKEDKLYLVVGTPGGARIITSVMETILNVLDFKMGIQDAVNFPRFHHQWNPDALELEPGISPDTRALLAARGHKITERSSICEMSSIQVEGGWLSGAADPRVEGKAAGY
jgi:gamma-glutamyltranspeptidase/glutathione hydrolase